MISVGGISSGNCVTNSFSGALRTLDRVVHHQGLRVDALQDVGGGDVGHVERRVLAHQHDVEASRVDHLFIAQREMVALLAAQLIGRARAIALPSRRVSWRGW